MASTDTRAQGLDTASTTTDPIIPDIKTSDGPFSGQRREVNPFAENGVSKTEVATSGSPTSPVDRRMSTDEWDAAKTLPSRFQQRKGSVYATPGSRDGHVDKNYARDAKFHELVDKKYGSGKRTPSVSKGES